MSILLRCLPLLALWLLVPLDASAQVDESSAELDNIRARGLGGPKDTADLPLFPEFSAGVFTYKTAVASSHSGGVWVTHTVKENAQKVRQSVATSNNRDDTSNNDNVLRNLPVTMTLTVTSIDRTATKTYRVEISVAPSATAPTGVAVASRPETLRVTWDAAPDEFISNYSVRWRTAAQDPDGTPGNSDDVAAGNWQGNTAAAGNPVTIGDEDDGVGVGRALGYTIAGLTDDTAYDIQVRGENINGDSGWSSSQSATTGDEGDATLSALAAAGSDSSALVFTPSFDAETEDYVVRMGGDLTTAALTPTFTQSGASATIAFDGGTATAITSGAASSAQSIAAGASSTAAIVVTASDSSTTKTYTVVIRRDPTAPGAPTGVSASAGPLSGTVVLAWTAPTNTGGIGVALTGYRVRWRTAGNDGPDGVSGNADDVAAGPWQDSSGDDAECNDSDATNEASCGEQTTGAAAHTVSGLTDGTPYDISLASVSAHGVSAWSAAVQVTPSGEGRRHFDESGGCRRRRLHARVVQDWRPDFPRICAGTCDLQSVYRRRGDCSAHSPDGECGRGVDHACGDSADGGGGFEHRPR